MKSRSKTVINQFKSLKNKSNSNKNFSSVQKFKNNIKNIMLVQNDSNVSKSNSNQQNINSELAIFCLTLLQIQKLKSLQLFKQTKSTQSNLFQDIKYNKFDVKLLYQFIFLQLTKKEVHSKNQNQVLVYYILSTLIDQNLAIFAQSENKRKALSESESQTLKIVINQLLIQFYRQKKWIKRYLKLKKVKVQNNPHLFQEIMYESKKILKIIKSHSSQRELKQYKKCKYIGQFESFCQQLESICFSKMVKFINLQLKCKQNKTQQESATYQRIKKSKCFNITSFQTIKLKLINHRTKSSIKHQQTNNLLNDYHDSKKFPIYLSSFAQIIFRLIQSPKNQIKNSYSKTYRKIYTYLQNIRQKQMCQLKKNQKEKIKEKHLQKKLIQYIDIKRQAQNHFKVTNLTRNKQNQTTLKPFNQQIKSKQTSIETTARCLNCSPSISDLNKKQTYKLQQTPIKNLNFNVVQQKQLTHQFKQILPQNENKYKLKTNEMNRQSPSFNIYSNQKQDNSDLEINGRNQKKEKNIISTGNINKNMSKYEIVEQLFKIRQLRRSLHDNFFVI